MIKVKDLFIYSCIVCIISVMGTLIYVNYKKTEIIEFQQKQINFWYSKSDSLLEENYKLKLLKY